MFFEFDEMFLTWTFFWIIIIFLLLMLDRLCYNVFALQTNVNISCYLWNILFIFAKIVEFIWIIIIFKNVNVHSRL